MKASFIVRFPRTQTGEPCQRRTSTAVLMGNVLSFCGVSGHIWCPRRHQESFASLLGWSPQGLSQQGQAGRGQTPNHRPDLLPTPLKRLSGTIRSYSSSYSKSFAKPCLVIATSQLLHTQQLRCHHNECALHAAARTGWTSFVTNVQKQGLTVAGQDIGRETCKLLKLGMKLGMCRHEKDSVAAAHRQSKHSDVEQDPSSQ